MRKSTESQKTKNDETNPILCNYKEYNQLCETVRLGHPHDSIEVPPRHRLPAGNPTKRTHFGRTPHLFPLSHKWERGRGEGESGDKKGIKMGPRK